MKLLLSVVALVAFTQTAPITHTLELGSNGITGSLDTPLVSIEVNIIKDGETLVPETVNNPVLEAEPVIVVDTPVVAAPTPVEVVDVSPEIVMPAPVEIVDVNPTPVEVVDVNPEIVMPAPVEVVDVNPNPVEVVDVNPEIVMPAPVEVVDVNPDIVMPAPVEVVDVNPAPAEVVDMTHGGVEAGATGSQIINVILNFVFGSDGAISSVEVPPQTVNQLVGMARSL